MNKTFIQKIKDFWNEHKTAIKVGAAFGILGFVYGAYEGCTATNKIWLESLTKAMDEAKDETIADYDAALSDQDSDGSSAK